MVERYWKNTELLKRILRTDRLVTRILGRKHKTDMERIEIDITWQCNLNCRNCDRSCRQAPTNEQMTTEQIEKFVTESITNRKTWKTISILGGEPTLHPRLPEIIQILQQYKRTHSPETSIVLVSNGYGKKVEDILLKFEGQITINNTAKKSQHQTIFEPFNIAPVDLPFFRRTDFANGCWITAYCGMALTPYGYYPCAVAGGIDRIFGFGIGKPRLPDCSEMESILQKTCRFCGHFIRGNFVPKSLRPIWDEEMSSHSWQKAYRNYLDHKPSLAKY